MAQQTAVEWLAQQVLSYKSPTNINGTDYILIPINKVELLKTKAKQMEKEQMKKTWKDGFSFQSPYKNFEQYYNEQYGQGSPDTSPNTQNK